MLPHEAFLSHSSHDHVMAEQIARVLRAHGVPTYFAPSNLLGAQQWQDEILRALERCDWFIVLLSPAAVTSMWVRREVAQALSDPRYEGKIVPLRWQDCELATLKWLRPFQMIDFRGSMDDGCRDLLRVWGLGLKSPGVT
jgi:hypothetical protein